MSSGKAILDEENKKIIVKHEGKGGFRVLRKKKLKRRLLTEEKLGSLPLQYKDCLSQRGKIPLKLKQGLINIGINLSRNASKRAINRKKWEIKDRKVYIIKEEKGTLRVSIKKEGISYRKFCEILGDECLQNYKNPDIREAKTWKENILSNLQKNYSEKEDKLNFYDRDVVKLGNRIRNINGWGGKFLGLDKNIITDDKETGEIKLNYFSIEKGSDDIVKFYSNKNADILRALEEKNKKESLYIIGREAKEGISAINIPTIDDVLERGKTFFKKPKPFRSSGPMWVDFEEGGHLVERSEVDEIIKGLEANGIEVIKGRPSSGKTTLLRNVGYKLSEVGESVYLIELKKNLPDISEVMKLRDCYLLIDDAHLDKDFVSQVLDRSRNIKILVTIRSIEDLLGGEKFGKLEELISEAKLLEARDVADDIIKNYEKNRGKITSEAKKKLNDYKDDLWLLVWALEAYEKTRRVDKEEILKWVKRWMEKDLDNDYGIEKASDVLYLLSVFYRYEIEIKRGFLEKLGINGNIDKLIKINEVVEKDRKLVLHHSRLAELYLETIERFDLSKQITEQLSKEELFHSYIQNYPEESIGVLCKLLGGILSSTIVSLSQELSQENRIFIEKLIKRNSKNIKKGIDAERNLEIFIEFIFWINTMNLGILKELEEKALKKLPKKLRARILTIMEDIIETASVPSSHNLNFYDARFLIKEGTKRGIAMIGLGESDTRNRAEEAVLHALENPLLEVDYRGATRALIHITGGEDLTLGEAQHIGKYVTKCLKGKVNVIWGSRIDKEYNGRVRIIIIMTK